VPRCEWEGSCFSSGHEYEPFVPRQATRQRGIVGNAERCYRSLPIFVRYASMKPNPERLELATYPHRTEISLRFADIDPQWHLNNVRVGEYYQEGRVAFFRHLQKDHGYERAQGSRTLVVHQSIDYLEEVTYPGSVTIGIGVSRLGTTSWSFGMGMFKNGRCAGLSTTVLVYGLNGGPAPLPQGYRELLEKFLLPATSLA
jgi:acyl-CoA thioester hydrolase